MKALFVKTFALLLIALFAGGVRAADIAVVISSDAKIYQEALEGFREVVGHRISSVQTLKDNPATWRDELKKVRSTIEPDLVFVIGTPALQAVSGEITNIPVVHAMVFNPLGVLPGHGKNVIGIGMNPSAAQTASLIRELNPKYRRVGTMFNPSRGGSLLQQAHSVFEKAGLQLVAREIRSVSEIGGALKSLENEIDIFWLWPEETFLADDILQRIVLFSFERKIPVLGLSERHTEIGALVSLSYGSAMDLGRQAGDAANRVLGDANATLASVIFPRQIKLTVNLKTARKFNVKIPGSIINRADNGIKAPVYRNGDWWVFRIKTLYPGGRAEVEEHRITFKNGSFETEHPIFLTGGDLPGTPSFLAFPSVFLEDPDRKWLDFPLLPGKSWSFNYSSVSYVRGKPRRTRSVAEVLGKSSKPIQTAAGAFEAIEISRHDQLGPVAYSTYFYSPLTKSVVRLKAEIDVNDPRSSGRQFELELIAYGTDRNQSR
jgi:putative tryptophan/tyrosine transport system substrate-binding protein